MSDVVILVPRRRGSEERERLWRHVRRHYASLGLPVFEGHHEANEGRFNRSKAINRAAAAAGDWKVAFVTDADTVADPALARGAIARAGATGEMVLTFNRLHLLNRQGTAQILNGYSGSWQRFIKRTLKDSNSSSFAVARSLFDRTLGFDERFDGWGWEDIAFANAALAYADLYRTPGEAWHLWHAHTPERKDVEHPSYEANRALAERYKYTRRDVNAGYLGIEAMDTVTGFTGPDGVRRPYFSHPYNHTFRNERAIEVPLALAWLEGAAGPVLEVGNVLGHYRRRSWPVIDLYEHAAGVTNVDVVDYVPPKPVGAIVSISTLEHVGRDEGDDPAKALKALQIMRGWLTTEGRLFVTIPLGHNPALDEAILDGSLGALEEHFWRRDPDTNSWHLLDEPSSSPYNRQIWTATTLYIGVFGR